MLLEKTLEARINLLNNIIYIFFNLHLSFFLLLHCLMYNVMHNV